MLVTAVIVQELIHVDGAGGGYSIRSGWSTVNLSSNERHAKTTAAQFAK